MSRQNRNPVRDRKTEEAKRDVANGVQRINRQNRQENRMDPQRTELTRISGLDRNRLNDLYERSSL